MSTELDAMKAIMDAMSVAARAIETAGNINEVLRIARERGTPWNDSDRARVAAIQKESEDRLLAARKAAGFI